MATALVLILALGIMAFVGGPLFSVRDDDWLADEEDRESPAQLAASQRRNVFSALNELEYDFHMDKVSEADYREMKNQLTLQAVSMIQGDGPDLGRDADRTAAPDLWAEVEAEIEAEVAAELEAKSPADMGAGICTACGASLWSGTQRFCQQCGSAVEKTGVRAGEGVDDGADL